MAIISSVLTTRNSTVGLLFPHQLKSYYNATLETISSDIVALSEALSSGVDGGCLPPSLSSVLASLQRQNMPASWSLGGEEKPIMAALQGKDTGLHDACTQSGVIRLVVNIGVVALG